MEPGTQTTRIKAAVLAAVWVATLLAVFFSLELPNNPPVRRWQIWQAVPGLLDLVDPPPRDPTSGHAGWQYVSQRFDLLAVAGFILAAAWGVGHLVLRIVRPPLPVWCAERTVFAFGAGLAALSLMTLAAGLFGALSRPLLAGVLACALVCEFLLRFMRRRESGAVHHGEGLATVAPSGAPATKSQNLVFVIAIAPFVSAMLLGAMLPSTDFDVNEYHFEGPKEFFQAGRISFLEHNVYTSFPFGTEMLTLLGMVLRNDWYRGALAGKCVLMSFGPLTAAALFVAGRRWYGTLAGLCAAFLYLSTPWVYRISTIAYAEGGVSFFLFATLLAVMISFDPGSRANSCDRRSRRFLLAGLMAGSAMACKYPALVSVVVPLGMAVCVQAWKSRSQTASAWSATLAFACGVALFIGPWLVKNAVETGNPVYPLEYRLFGGRDWNAAIDARWKKAHSPDSYAPATLLGLAFDVTVRNDWVNPLLFALAPLSLLARPLPRRNVWIWAYIGWLLLSCWLLTHRIDRFWVPMLPVVALLAGVGAAWAWASAPAAARIPQVFGVAAIALFNLATVTCTGLGGYNDYLRDLDEAAVFAARHSAPELFYLRERLPSGSKVLSVGDAAVFEARFPIVYNTVFDRSILEDWIAVRRDDHPESTALRPPEEIREKLRAEGITHIYVSWREILRYRSPGNYGYTGFVTPGLFAELQRLGILGEAWPIPDAAADVKGLDPARREELETWGRPLIIRRGDGDSFVTFEVFPVKSAED